MNPLPDNLLTTPGVDLYEAFLRQYTALFQDGAQFTPLPPGMKETPGRVVRFLNEALSGYRMNAKEILSATFEDETISRYGGMVIETGIPFYSLCEHHLVPFFGTVDIGYIPDGKVVGLSKLARVVDMFARRFQVQERMTTQIVEAIQQHLKPRGVIVSIHAEHLCMAMRGIQKPGVVTTTNHLCGVFETDASAKQEFLTFTLRK